MRLTRRDNQTPQKRRNYVICECIKTFWSTFGQLIKTIYTSLFTQGGFCLLCKAKFNLLGGSGFCFEQNISIDVSGDAYITMP